MKNPFHLHAPRPSSATLVLPDAELPAEVAGQPAAYFWKEMIHAGHYVHPNRGYSLKVDRERLSRWLETGTNMLAAGVPIPINCDHSDRARDVVGYVKRFKLDNHQLLGLCQFIGPDAALTAARNWVSVGVNPDFTDGEARNWGEAIVHLALTPVPVVPDQGEFVDASGDDTLVLTPDDAEEQGEPPVLISCTADQLDLLRELLPGGTDLTAENCIGEVIEYLQSSAEAELSIPSGEVVEFSAHVSPPPLGGEAEVALVEAATIKLDAAVAKGSLSPAVRVRLLATMVRSGDGKANLYALSRAANPTGDRALALAIADILLDNQPIALGERTGLQAFSRPIPGEESSAIDELRQYMTKVASVSG
ncbi:MAG: hypothetical protein ABSF29_04500 [Tepidisphaeraceae bacterium]|jgi:hypothetical protein